MQNTDHNHILQEVMDNYLIIVCILVYLILVVFSYALILIMRSTSEMEREIKSLKDDETEAKNR